MADEIKIRITADADDALKGLHDVTKAEKELAEETEQGGRKADAASVKDRERAHQTDKLAGSLDNATREQRQASEAADEYAAKSEAAGTKTNVLSTALVAAGGAAGVISLAIQTLNKLLDEQNTKIESANRLLQENANIARSNAEARLNLASLSGVETAEDVAFLDAAAAFSGRSQGELARVQAQIASALPTASKQEVQDLVKEIASTGQTTDAGLTALTPAFLSLYRLTGDARVANNLLQGAIKAAGEADPAKLGTEIGKFVAIGKEIGGLDPATNVGFAAAGTGLGLPNEVATTGLKNVIFSLRGKGTPEGVKILDRERIPRENLVGGLLAIQAAVEAGRISSAELETIGGREAAPVFAALSDRETLNRFLESVEIVREYGARPGRASEEKAAGIVASSEAQKANLLAKQQEAATKSIKSGDIRALEAEAAGAIVDRVLAERLAEGTITPDAAEGIRAEFKRYIGKGVRPSEAAGRSGNVRSTSQWFRPAVRPFDDELAREVETGLQSGPVTRVKDAFAPQGEPTVIINNYGTTIHHGKDPYTSDLVGANVRR